MLRRSTFNSLPEHRRIVFTMKRSLFNSLLEYRRMAFMMETSIFNGILQHRVVGFMLKRSMSKMTLFSNTVPGPVELLEDRNIGDNHINLQWRPPLDNKGDIIGYDISYQEGD